MKAWNLKKKEYNAEPVYYCSNCLSLNIRGEIEGCEYCDECGSTAIELSSIEEWEKLYEQIKGYKFLQKKKY